MDEAWFYALVVIFIFLAVMMCDELNDRFKRIPFGPIRVPLIGNLHQVYIYNRKYSYKALTTLASRHGATMKIWFGTVGSVVLSGYDRISQILRSEEWLGEQDPAWILDRTTKSSGNKESTVTENADSIRSWASSKMYANQALNDLGFNEHVTLDNILQRKSRDLCNIIQEYLKADNGANTPLNTGIFLPFAMSVNWTLATGETCRMDEHPTLLELLKLVRQWEAATIRSSKYLDNWPYLRHIAPGLSGFTQLSEVNLKIKRLLQNIVQEHKARSNKNAARHLIDKFLAKIEENEDAVLKKSPFSSEVLFTNDMLISVLFNILFPSTLVLESTLNFALFYLCRNEDLQRSLRNEIREKMGKQTNRALTMNDLTKMPNLAAFLLEVQRAGNVIPLEKRKMLKTVREEDTRVTRGMTLIFNYDSGNFDKQVWKDPYTFQVERFLEIHNGRAAVINEEKLLAATAVKRLCIGETVMKPALVHAIASLLLQFSFITANNKGKSDQVERNPHWGIINKPPHYDVAIGMAV